MEGMNNMKVGNLGKALIEASKKEGGNNWLKKQLDVYFKKLRQQRKKNGKKRNLPRNDKHHTK
jgi:hypothetical protein